MQRLSFLVQSGPLDSRCLGNSVNQNQIKTDLINVLGYFDEALENHFF